VSKGLKKKKKKTGLKSVFFLPGPLQPITAQYAHYVPVMPIMCPLCPLMGLSAAFPRTTNTGSTQHRAPRRDFFSSGNPFLCHANRRRKKQGAVIGRREIIPFIGAFFACVIAQLVEGVVVAAAAPLVKASAYSPRARHPQLS
jgi:hypothetical protein